MDLTKTFTPEQFSRGLESWGWLGIEDKVPMFTSLFGDVFFRSPDGFWWLDTTEGNLTRPWKNAEDLKKELATIEGQDHYLSGWLALGAERQGVIPTVNQVYIFTIPPVAGGAFTAENVGVIDFVVGLNIAGQLHEQVRDLPPGTPISGFTIGDG